MHYIKDEFDNQYNSLFIFFPSMLVITSEIKSFPCHLKSFRMH